MMKDHRGGGIKLRHKGGLLIVRKQVEGERLGWVSRNHSDTVQRHPLTVPRELLAFSMIFCS